MQKEFGKWLLDIAKYMVTALLLSTIFADLNEPIVLYVVAIVAFALLLGGLWVIYASDQKSRQEYKPKKKGNRR